MIEDCSNERTKATNIKIIAELWIRTNV